VLRVYGFIAHQHDPLLVALAAIIALFGAHTAILLLRHGDGLRGANRRIWLLAAAIAAGTTTWATHFVGMLAFQPHIEVNFAIGLTALSLLVAIGIMGTGFALALYRPGWRVRAAAGAFIGLGIGAMQYTGISAVALQGYLDWNPAAVALSLLVAILFGAMSLICALNITVPAARWAAPAMMWLAICLSHLIGMGAVSVHSAATPASLGQLAAMSPHLLAANLSILCVLVLVISVAALHLNRSNMRRAEEERTNLRDLADMSVEGLILCDGASVVTANASFRQMSGFTQDALRNATLDFLFEGTPAQFINPGSYFVGEHVVIGARGERIPVEVVRKSIVYSGKPHQVLALRDLRERRRAEEEIRFLAHHDSLTGLANRVSFGATLHRQIQENARDQKPFAVFALDLDRFKDVNDLLGHQTGDLLLQRVAGRLRATVRDTDCIARLGGDEFAILVSGPLTIEKSAILADRLVEVLSRPYILDGKIVNIGVSIGIAISPQDGPDASALMKHADLALYRAKSDGRNTSRRYEASMDAELQSRRKMELDLRRAIVHGHLEMHYQPLFNVRTQSVRGFEALLRWRHPIEGLISPNDFIPMAEETGLILPIGEFVLNASTREAASWDNEISVSVNLSAVQFSGGKLVETVRAALAGSGLAPERLELEITESVLLQESADTLKTLHQLRDLGVRIAMDDFGTGYSSLRYLRSFPFDRIKIDRSFIQEMLSNNESAAIISAVVALSQRLGIMTTAEGVETEEQMSRIQAEGCDTVQGFLIGRPATPEEVGKYLRTRVKETA